MKRLALILMASTLLLVGGPSFAEICTVDAVPAATLLLPYFEVNLDDPAQGNTFFSINNASAAAALAHVTLWTNWSHPTIDFDVYLTGYDVVQVNLYDVFQGNIPITADDQSDLIINGADDVSPDGGFRPDGGFVTPSQPQWDSSFPNCNNFFPFFNNPVIKNDNLVRLRNGHTGQPIPNLFGGCLGATYGDNVARGYVTVDNVETCSTEFPSDAGYFTGVANYENQLWGDWFYTDASNAFAQGDNLVHVEATNADPLPFAANGYTFYGRYADGILNFREPLGLSWGVRYLNNALFTGGTDFIVWRDSTVDDIGATQLTGYTCGGVDLDGDPDLTGGPDWYPLNETEVVAFDDFENAVVLCFTGEGGVISPQDPADDPPCFPLETQRIASTNLGFEGISSPWDSGWMYLNLNVGIDTVLVGNDFDPGSGGTLAQSYVAATHSANGIFSVGLQAIELVSACEDLDLLLTDVCGNPGICIIPQG